IRKEAELTSMTEEDILYQEERTQHLGASSASNELPTKVLESAVIDRTDAVAFPLSDVLFYQWQYLSAIDDYRARVNVSMPNTGEQIILHVREAFLLYAYAVSAAYDETP